MNDYPDQNNQNPNCNKYGLQNILEQSGNKLFGQEWPKGDIANDKRDWKSQIDNGWNRPESDHSHFCKGIMFARGLILILHIWPALKNEGISGNPSEPAHFAENQDLQANHQRQHAAENQKRLRVFSARNAANINA